ncbi:hypothetical protein K1719_002183 [Acacia pycnantha]|nr:hypothetical protein K1719_002183 [Acacia pycnantha]
MEIYGIDDSSKIMRMIRRHLCEKKVLLVLDDIENMSQLKDLAECPDWFGKGSRIIITTRDRHVLTSIGVERMERIYEMKTMKNDESLQIFSKKAFNKNHPEEKYLEYSNSVVKYAGGLPLALQALGSYLCGRSEDAVWRDVLNKLKRIPHKDILQVLKISYDGLDEKERTIFLDIVCLFQRWKKEEVTQILKACNLNPIIGIKVLIEKTLLVETEGGKLDMHDLYEDLGWYMIQQKFPNSKLRKFGEIKDVLENNKVPTGLKKLSGALKFVRWPSFPLEALPLPLDELVHIEMQYSNLKQLWNGIKSMNHLKFINLSNSRNFTETPDFSNVQSLEHLYLSWCVTLVKGHESLGVLKELVEVDLQGCENLDSLPSKLETNSLRKLDLGLCGNVKKLPEFGEGMKKLEYLDASHTAITTLPKSFGFLTGLRELNLSATHLINLPTDCFSGLFGLVLLSLGDCDWLESLPRLPPRLIRLEAGGCFTVKCSLDEQMLNLVTSLDHECREKTKYVITDDEEENMPRPYENYYYSPFELKDVEPKDLPLRDFFATLPSGLGGKIPSLFDSNIKYYEKARSKCEIEVDIPPNFRASKWSGIVVCLHIKGHDGFIRWSSKAPKDYEYNIWQERSRGIGSLHGDGLCIMVLEFNEKTYWQHLRGHNNSLHIQLSFDKYPMIVEDDSDILDILGCGWRVICKEDIQNWCHPNHLNHSPNPNMLLLMRSSFPWDNFAKSLGFQ